MKQNQENGDWWSRKISWDCPAGRLLQKFFMSISERPTEITIFGSAALQLSVNVDFLSADVDFFSERDFHSLIDQLHLGKGQCEFYLEQPPAKTFICAVDWASRAHVEYIDGIKVNFPHPLDILISKVKRLEEKDLQAFYLVREKTGHPHEEELIRALQNVVDIFRPSFDEENSGGDPIQNVRRLWIEFFGKEIDVREKIIRPALEERKKYYTPLSEARTNTVRKLREEL